MNSSMKATTAGVLTTASLSITGLTWSGSGTAGDTLLVEDNNGRIIWQAEAPGTNYNLSMGFSKPVVVFGINVITIGSGTLVVAYV